MDFKDKKIVIVGFGLEGRSTLGYLQNLGVSRSSIAIVDNNKDLKDTPNDIATILGDDAMSKIKDFDIVFRSPQIRPDRIVTDGEVWSATNEFFDKCPTKNIIGVTGTKGKGTTSTLITESLRNAGKVVHLVGNIGVPALDVLPHINENDFVVFELSSFQLWDIKFSPHVAVVLMIVPDHMEVHTDMEEYIEAKGRICKFQDESDVVVRHPNNPNTSQAVMVAKSQKLAFMSDNKSAAYIENEHVMIDDQPVCATGDVGLLGEHNLQNICAAVTVVWQFTQDVPAIQKALKEFTGLPHRLQFVREVRGVKFYDDSQATGPTPTIAALKAFEGKNRVLVFGGSDKGLDVTPVLKEINQNDQLVLIGQSTESLSAKADELGLRYHSLGLETDMNQVAAKCQEITEFGDVVLLSPAHASFDMFDSYVDRGNKYQDAVNSLPS